MASKGFLIAFTGRACFVVLLLLLPCPSATPNDMTSTLLIGGARIDVTVEQNDSPLSQPDLLRWVQSAAESVAAYYGRFPLPHLILRVTPFAGTGVRNGRTFGREGGLILIRAGSKTTASGFAQDWVLTHEMVHLAFPSMADEHHWIEEGISTYVEPIARIRAGHWTASQMWSDLMRDMPKGLPRDGDQGLDHTHTWGRTYWGGALFCLVTDVEIRKQTQNRKGLEDALRGILDAGGDIRVDWDLAQTLKVADRAAGVEVLEKLYAEMKDRPVQVDLPALWKQLGVEGDGEKVHFNEDAPLAAIRRSITEGTKVPPGKGAATKDSASRLRPLVIFAGRTAGSR